MEKEKIIKNLADLKKLFSGEHENDCAVCRVILNGGLDSWKNISFDGDSCWWVFNEIDNTEDEYDSDEELMNSIIGEAINKQALVFEWF